jgi:hypothetical protein
MRLAELFLSFTTTFTGAARVHETANTDDIAGFELRDPGAHTRNAADDFVAWNHGVR